MIFRSTLLLLLLVSQPLAALDLACTPASVGSPVSEHCAGMDHATAESAGTQDGHDQTCADSCDACATAVVTAVRLAAPETVASEPQQLLLANPAAGHSVALFRPPILN